MPASPFDGALPFILRWEGGFVDHPSDPGGRTNRGVTQRTFTAWLARNGQPSKDVKSITDDEVKAIYEADYWLPPRCNDLPSRLDLVQFDTAVNMGVGRAVRFLQAAVGCRADGQFGAETSQAIAGCDTRTTLVAYCQSREDFYRRLVVAKPALQVFLAGWSNRLNALRKEVNLPVFGFAGATGPGGPAPTMKIPDVGVDPSFDI